MDSPLRTARLKHQKTLQEVADAVGIDTGNLSRIERGMQVPSKDLTAALVKYFGGDVTEMEIIFPERFAAEPNVTGGA